MKNKVNLMQLTPHFNLSEFQCKCCCHVKIWAPLLHHLEALRLFWKNPLVITSGFRCLRHNKKIGGVAHSLHTQGRAVDIVVMKSRQPFFCKLAKKAGFTSIIAYGKRNFVHLALKTERSYRE